MVDFKDASSDLKEDEYWEVIERAEGASMSRLTENRTYGRLKDIWHLLRDDFGIELCDVPSPISNFSLRNRNPFTLRAQLSADLGSLQGLE